MKRFFLISNISFFCHSALITDTKELEGQVIELLKKALEPCLTSVSISWGKYQVQQSPFVIR